MLHKLESGFEVEFEVLQRKRLGPFHEDHPGLVEQMFVDGGRRSSLKCYEGLVISDSKPMLLSAAGGTFHCFEMY